MLAFPEVINDGVFRQKMHVKSIRNVLKITFFNANSFHQHAGLSHFYKNITPQYIM